MTIKAPKLRFKPGEFLRNKKTKELYCIRYAYRLESDPFVWVFYLEERSLKLGASEGLISYDLYPSSMYADIDISRRMGGMYRFGNACHVNNKRVINEFEKVDTE